MHCSISLIIFKLRLFEDTIYKYLSKTSPQRRGVFQTGQWHFKLNTPEVKLKVFFYIHYSRISGPIVHFFQALAEGCQGHFQSIFVSWGLAPSRFLVWVNALIGISISAFKQHFEKNRLRNYFWGNPKMGYANKMGYPKHSGVTQKQFAPIFLNITPVIGFRC